jgi:hypothetical protein
MNIRVGLFILFVTLCVAQLLSACAAGSALFADPTPTAMPTPTTDPYQSAKIVQAFWDALEGGDLETAMTYIAEDAKCNGYCYFTGKTAFRSYLQGYLEAGHVTEISELKCVGNIVTYTWAVYRNGNFVSSGDADEIMQVEDGLIVYWENQHR